MRTQLIQRINSKFPQNVELNTPMIMDILNYISIFIKDKGPFDLVVLLGIAYDSAQTEFVDRGRFRNAIQLLAENPSGRDRLVLCVDPNFNQENIMKTLTTLLYTMDVTIDEKKNNYLEPLIKSMLMNGKDVKITNINLYKNLVNIHLLKTIVRTKNGENPSTFYFLFLNYPLESEHPIESKYKRSIFRRVTNSINIQAGKKTIQTYLEDPTCKYGENTFYKALETLALQPAIHSVYVASAVSSHDHYTIEYNDKKYRASIKTTESKILNYWYIDNRYLEGICELLSFMRKLSQESAAINVVGAGAPATGKPVYFIQLDRVNITFAHKNVPIEYNPISKEPYLVPFTKETTFNTEHNPFVELKGGKRNTRKTHKKKRSTRGRR